MRPAGTGVCAAAPFTPPSTPTSAAPPVAEYASIARRSILFVMSRPPKSMQPAYLLATSRRSSGRHLGKPLVGHLIELDPIRIERQRDGSIVARREDGTHHQRRVERLRQRPPGDRKSVV